MKIPLLFGLLLLIINLISVESRTKRFIGGIQTLFDVLKKVKKTYTIIKDASSEVKDMKELGETAVEVVFAVLFDEDEKEDTSNSDISSQLNKMMMRIDSRFGTIEKLIDELPLSIDIDRIKQEIASILRRIWNFHRDAVKYSMEISKYNRIELNYFVDAVTGLDNDNLRKSLTNLYSYIDPSIGTNLKKSYLDLWNDHIEAKGSRLCGDSQSISQDMYHLYETILDTEMLGQMTLGIGYLTQKLLHHVDTDFELEKAEQEIEQRLTGYFRKFRKSITQASNVLRPCDPSSLIKDVTYIEMERLFQKVLTNDYYLAVGDTCSISCEDIDVNVFDNSEYNCTTLNQCKNLGDADYCFLDNDRRRYQWIKDDGGKTYGDSASCRGTEKSLAHWIYWAANCEVCVCTCQAGKTSYANATYSVDTRLMTSDYSHNKVITGLKFVRCSPSEVSIIIKQGLLLPGGRIQENSENWKKCGHHPQHTFITKDSNHININDVFSPQSPNAVVVGLQLQVTDVGNQKHISLALQFANFDYDTGLLQEPKHMVYVKNCGGKRVNIPDVDSPFTQTSGENIPNPTEGYIQFGPSSLDGDAGQTTIPLFDAQSVESKPSTPLSGIGLFYKSMPGYGGFLGFRIHTLNHGKFMEEDE